MASSTVYSPTTGKTPGKLSFNPRVVTTPATFIDDNDDENNSGTTDGTIRRNKDNFSLLKPKAGIARNQKEWFSGAFSV